MRPRPDGKVRIVPSLLAADFSVMRREVAPLVRAGCEWMSVDVMDGHFVPNLSFGPDLVRAFRKRFGSRLWLDAHLMAEKPGFFGPVFSKAGADWVVFHMEACRSPRPLIRELRRLGTGVGAALKPRTPVRSVLPLLPQLDLVLVMTVEPGFGGQSFMRSMTAKLRTLRREIDRGGRKVWLQVDGGIDRETAVLAAAAGADAMVAGTAVFRAEDPAAAYREMRRRAQRAFDRRRRKHGSSD